MFITYMEDEVDSGKIIYQEKVLLKDLSLEKIYQHIFSNVVSVIEKGLKILIK